MHKKWVVMEELEQQEDEFLLAIQLLLAPWQVGVIAIDCVVNQTLESLEYRHTMLLVLNRRRSSSIFI